MSVRRRMAVAMACLVLAAFAPGDGARACSIVVVPPSEFGGSGFLFTGDVLGVVGPREFANELTRTATWGLRVRVCTVFFEERSLAGVVEVYPLSYGAACETVGVGREAVERAFPPGSRVRVSASAWKRYDSGPSTPPSVLVAALHHHAVTVASGPWAAAADSHLGFDYEAWHRWYVREIRTWRANPNTSSLQLDRYEEAMWFELEKDLLALSRARSDAEALAIVERLAYFADWSFRFETVVKTNVDRRSAIERLCARRAAWERDYFDAYRLAELPPPSTASELAKAVEKANDTLDESEFYLTAVSDDASLVFKRAGLVAREGLKGADATFVREARKLLSARGRIWVSFKDETVVVRDHPLNVDEVEKLAERLGLERR